MVGDGGSSLSDLKAVSWRWRNLGQLQHSNGKQYTCSGVTGHESTVNDRVWLSWEWSVQWHDSGDTNTQATWSHPDLSELGMEGQKSKHRFMNFEAVLYVVKSCGNISVVLCPRSWTRSNHLPLRPPSPPVTQIMPSPLFQLFTATLYGQCCHYFTAASLHLQEVQQIKVHTWHWLSVDSVGNMT